MKTVYSFDICRASDVGTLTMYWSLITNDPDLSPEEKAELHQMISEKLNTLKPTGQANEFKNGRWNKQPTT